MGRIPSRRRFCPYRRSNGRRVVKRIRSDRYDLNPEFQRDFVWSDSKQSRLIDPASCESRCRSSTWPRRKTVGSSWLTVSSAFQTFRRFLENKLKLSFARGEEDPLHPARGKALQRSGTEVQERVEDTQLTLYILDSKAPERAKLDIFERVNSGEPSNSPADAQLPLQWKCHRFLKRCAESKPLSRCDGRVLASQNDA